MIGAEDDSEVEGFEPGGEALELETLEVLIETDNEGDPAVVVPEKAVVVPEKAVVVPEKAVVTPLENEAVQEPAAFRAAAAVPAPPALPASPAAHPEEREAMPVGNSHMVKVSGPAVVESTIASSADVWQEISQRLVRVKQRPLDMAPVAHAIGADVTASLSRAEEAFGGRPSSDRKRAPIAAPEIPAASPASAAPVRNPVYGADIEDLDEHTRSGNSRQHPKHQNSTQEAFRGLLGGLRRVAGSRGRTPGPSADTDGPALEAPVPDLPLPPSPLPPPPDALPPPPD